LRRSALRLRKCQCRVVGLVRAAREAVVGRAAVMEAVWAEHPVVVGGAGASQEVAMGSAAAARDRGRLAAVDTVAGLGWAAAGRAAAARAAAVQASNKASSHPDLHRLDL